MVDAVDVFADLLLDVNDAVAVRHVFGDAHRRHDTALRFVVGIHQRFSQRDFARHVLIAQQHDKRFVSGNLGLQNSVTESIMRVGLTHIVDVWNVRLLHQFQHLRLAFSFKFLQRDIYVKMVFDRTLAFPGVDDDLFDAGSHSFFHHILDTRCIHDPGIISLAIAFVAGKKRVPKPAAGITAFRTFVMCLPLFHE